MIEISNDKYVFKFDGVEFEVAQASVDQEIEHEKKLQAIQKTFDEDEDAYGKLIQENIRYLVMLGAPEGLLKKMPRNGLQIVKETVQGLKKS